MDPREELSDTGTVVSALYREGALLPMPRGEFAAYATPNSQILRPAGIPVVVISDFQCRVGHRTTLSNFYIIPRTSA